MLLETVSRFLLLYGAFITGAVLVFMYLIARFYQRNTGDRTHYRWFLLPVLCGAVALIHNASNSRPQGDWLSHGLWIVGGVSLLALSLHLHRVMTQGRGD
jgi:uncharacterized membrane protein YdcZ (DUF606 family)